MPRWLQDANKRSTGGRPVKRVVVSKFEIQTYKTADPTTAADKMVGPRHERMCQGGLTMRPLLSKAGARARHQPADLRSTRHREEESATPVQPHRAYAVPARTSPGRTQKQLEPHALQITTETKKDIVTSTAVVPCHRSRQVCQQNRIE